MPCQCRSCYVLMLLVATRVEKNKCEVLFCCCKCHSRSSTSRSLQYKEETIATPKYVVDKLPWPRYVQRGVRVLNDTIFRARTNRVSTMTRGQCETLHSANSRRVQRLIRDYSRVNDTSNATSSQSVRILAMNDVGTDDEMPALVSSSSGSSTSSEAVFEEF